MTLDQLRALDPAALWVSLTAAQQASIIVPLLTSAFAEVCVEDDGTDCSAADQEAAATLAQTTYQQAWDAIDRAFPDILDPDLTALHGLGDGMQDDQGRVAVKGVHGRRKLYSSRSRHEGFVRIGGVEIEIGGFKNAAEAGQPPRWEAWTLDQIEAERLRRHPEQAHHHHPERIAA